MIVLVMLLCTACSQTPVQRVAKFLERNPFFYYFEGNSVYLVELYKEENSQRQLFLSRVKTDMDLSGYQKKGQEEQEAMVMAILERGCIAENLCPALLESLAMIDLDVDGKVDVYMRLQPTGGGKVKFFGIHLRDDIKAEDDKRSTPSKEDREMAQGEYAKMLERADKEMQKR